MKYLLKKLSHYGFNRRILTDVDFYRICEKLKITVLEMDITNSFYMSISGKAFIVLAKKLKGLKKTFTMFHELAHHLCHGGKDATAAFYFNLLDNKNEFEADALALIALIPVTALQSFEYLDEHPNRYARKLFRDRQRLYFLYGV